MFNFAILLLMFTVLSIILLGCASMIKGGEFNKKYGNLLMRARVYLQAFIILLLLLASFFYKYK